MAFEIERKFLCSLTREEAEKLSFTSRQVKSIYLESTKEKSFRVVKSKYIDGTINCEWTEKKTLENSIARSEEEWYLPTKIFDSLDNLGYPTIEKQRFLIDDNNNIWEIDFFEGYDFVIAELEFNSLEEATNFDSLPPWIIKEVTDDPFYLNCNLAF